MKIQLFLHHAGFDNRPALFGIHLKNAVQILRHIDHNGVTDSLACEAGPRTTWKHGNFKIPCDFHRGKNIFMRPWDDNADGFYFVNAGVCAVYQSRRTVEADFAIHARFQRVIEIFVHKGPTGV